MSKRSNTTNKGKVSTPMSKSKYLTTSPLQHNETKRSRFDEEYNSASMMSRNFQSTVSPNKTGYKRMNGDYDSKVKKDFSLDHLHEANDLEGLIQARRNKLDDVESEIKQAENRLNEIKSENLDNYENLKNNLLAELQKQKQSYKKDFDEMTKKTQEEYALKRKSLDEEKHTFNL